MPRLGFKMQLHPGAEDEYKKRHEEIWPALAELLNASGISDYSIFLDADTQVLFAVMQANDITLLEALPAHPLMQRWWGYMKDLMDTNADNSPVSIPLKELFYLP